MSDTAIAEHCVHLSCTTIFKKAIIVQMAADIIVRQYYQEVCYLVHLGSVTCSPRTAVSIVCMKVLLLLMIN